MPGGTDFFEPYDRIDRIPSPKLVAKGVIEIERLYDNLKPPKGVTVLDDYATRDEFSWGRAVRFEGSANSAFDLPLRIPNDDRYGVELYTTEGIMPDDYKIMYKGKPLGEKLWLTEGDHTFTLRFPEDVEGTQSLVLDYVIIRPWKGFITKWMVVGPFDNSDRKQLDTVYGPEEGIDFKKKYEGKDGTEVEWHEVNATRAGFVDLKAIMQAKGLPMDDVLAYAVTYIESPEAREVKILTGTDDGVKIWLNGEVVHKKDVYRSASPDADSVSVKLKKGRNTLLVKVHQGMGGWGFYLRIHDQHDDLKYHTK